MVPTTVPTTQPPPSPPDDGGGNDDGDTPPASVVVTGQPVRIPVNCEDPYDSLEEVLAGLTWEIDRKIVQWASVVGILEFPFCPEGPVYPDEAALDILGLPKFRELKPLPAALGTLLDVVDPELARMLELFLNLGFRSEKPAFLLCNAYLPMRHFCPKGARTANPLDVEEGYTWAWWSKVGPGSQPPKASEEFLKQYPEMVNYPDSAPYISAFFSAAEHHDREGPQRVCPRTTPNRNCDITMMQWFEALWRLHGQD
jgi:hypothetical protein